MIETRIRCSSTNNYGDCQRRAVTEIIGTEIEAAGFKLQRKSTGAPAHVGTGVHAAGALMLDEKLKTGTWSKDAAVDAGIEQMVERMEKDGTTWSDDVPNLGVAERQVQRMATAYHLHIAPKVQPVTIEHRLEADLGHGFVLSGQSDVVAIEPDAIRDLKTGANLGSYKPQIGGYGRLQRAWDKPAKVGIVDYIPRTKITAAQPPPIEIKIDIVAAEVANERIVASMMSSIMLFRNGSDTGGRKIPPFDPWSTIANPASRLCSPKFCRAHGTEFCKEWAK
jgi:hypothetical protein